MDARPDPPHAAARTTTARTTRAQTRRAAAELLQRTGTAATPAEIDAYVTLEQECAAVGAPAWFAPAVTEALAPLKTTLKTNQVIFNAAMANMVAERMTDKLWPVPNKAGALPPASLGFPANRKALRELTGPQLGGLLTFYEQTVPRTTAAKRARLCVVLSVRLSSIT